MCCRVRILEALKDGERSVGQLVADSRVLRMLELAHSLLENNAQHVAACRHIDG